MSNSLVNRGTLDKSDKSWFPAYLWKTSYTSLKCDIIYRASKFRRNCEGKNELVRSRPWLNIYFCSFCLLWPPLFDTMDATVTVHWRRRKTKKSWNVFDNTGRVLSETAVNDTHSMRFSAIWLNFIKSITFLISTVTKRQHILLEKLHTYWT